MAGLIAKTISLLKKWIQADIIKVFSLSAVSTVVRMITGLISIKVISVIIGPVGIALIGQLNNFSTIVMTFANGGINNGITKYVAEYKEDDKSIITLLSTALRITLFCSLLTGAIMIIFCKQISTLVMFTADYYYLFILFGFTLFLYALNMMLTSILNGYKEFKLYVSVNIVGSLLGLLFTLLLVFSLGLKGALISTLTFQSIMFFVTFYMIRKLPWVSWEYFKEKFNLLVAKKYCHYTLMTIITAITVPVSQLMLRGYVISNLSSLEAGWWEAMNRISGMYLLVITTSFSVYYLPRLSELKDKLEIKKEIIKAYKVIVPILIFFFSIIYILRIYVVHILFTEDFLPMENLFIWQLLGDFFKISSWLLASLLIAKSMTKIFVLAEILFAVLYVVLGIIFMNYNNIVGITQAYFINYVIYMLLMLFIFRKFLFR